MLLNKGFIQQKMLKLSLERQILSGRANRVCWRRGQWVARAKETYEERQRNTYQHSMFGSANNLAWPKQRGDRAGESWGRRRNGKAGKGQCPEGLGCLVWQILLALFQ